MPSEQPYKIVEDSNVPKNLIYFINPNVMYREPLREWPYEDRFDVVIKSEWEFEILYTPPNFVLGEK